MSSHGVFHVAAFNVLPQIAPFDHNFIACPIETTDAQIGHWAYRGFSKTSADPYTFQGPVVQSLISASSTVGYIRPILTVGNGGL